MKQCKGRTLVGDINSDVLAFTVGQDLELDLELVDADCIGSAAHVTMLSSLDVRPRLFSPAERKRVVSELVAIMRSHRRGRFKILLADQDVHLAVERVLTSKLGELGKKIHTARSRNDQVALDLRLYAKERILAILGDALDLIDALLGLARRQVQTPMVGRTHMQPAMPSSVGLWASAHAESLMDDVRQLQHAYAMNNYCPLGSAAGYGVPIAIDRNRVSRLLGFKAPVHNVLYASNARGKMESIILWAMSQAMLSLSRLAQDLMLYTMPELNYFSLPVEFCTGSSIMPQKRNPDVLELVRAKASRVLACAFGAADLIRGLPGGYNRDLQETKGMFMEGLQVTGSCLHIMAPLIRVLAINRQALLNGFTPSVFATDQALTLVAKGMPFRDAYRHVKTHLQALQGEDPQRAIARKTHCGATSGLDFNAYLARLRETRQWVSREHRSFHGTISRLLCVRYPLE